MNSVSSRSAGAQLLGDRYRCNDDIVTFDLTDEPRPEQGFFRFGETAICYGRCASGKRQTSPGGQMHDALEHVIIRDSHVSLPFDPAQAVGNLRAERYRGDERGLTFRALRNAYYRIRPMMPLAIRKRLQKVYLRGWNQIPFPEWPVDFTVDNIHDQLMLLALKARGGRAIPFVWFWPDGAESCTILTHDVETQTGVDFCSELMDLNDSFGIKSSFQIVPEERYPVDRSLLDGFKRRGFEVNIHDLNHDGHLFRNKDEFIRRARKINLHGREFGAEGFRSAIMYRNLDWFGALDFRYDMSLPNVAHLDPQRGGCCTVFPFFVGDMVELPLTTTQDYSLFHILGQYSMETWLEQIKRIRQRHGLISTSVHPDYVIDERARRVYKDLLAHLAGMRSADQTWITLPRQVELWWRQRSKLALVERGNSWTIQGEGCERAAVAFASLDGESVRYEVAGGA